MDRETLTKIHVLYPQSSVVEELIQCGKLDCESLYDEDAEVAEHGELVIDDYGCCWWGRTTSGQAIFMDSVIAEICDELE